MPPTITIAFDEPNHVTVTAGDLIADRLTNDEALWTVASLLMGKPCAWLRTAAENKAIRDAMSRLPIPVGTVDPDFEVKRGL